MKRKTNTAALLLMALALFLVGVGLWQTACAPDLLEYVLIAPREEGEIARLLGKKDDALETMKDTFSASAVKASAHGIYISAKDAGTGVQAALTAGGEGFFEVFPEYLKAGRLLSETELRTGAAKAVLDEDLAFALFPTVDPIGRTISADGVDLEVVGVVRHSRRVGETELYGVYAPLLAVQELPMETLSLAVLPLPGSGASIMFETTASDSWRAGGSFYNYAKETLRARLPLLYTAILFGFALLVGLLHRLNGLTISAVGKLRARLEHDYLPKVLPRMIAYALCLLAAYALLVLAAWRLGAWAVEPLYVFPEWVPENLVKWSAIRDVFWNLAVDASRSIDVAPAAVRALQFWAGVIRWGTIFGLVSALLLAFGRKSGK